MPNSLRIVQEFFPRVEVVEQGKRHIRIRVTPKDVVAGSAKAHQSCAMARACKRALHLDGAIVSLGTAYLIKGDVATRYQVPQAVSREIVSFDRGSEFAPGMYTLYKPQERAKRGSAAGTSHSNKRSGKKRPKRITANVRAVLSA